MIGGSPLLSENTYSGLPGLRENTNVMTVGGAMAKTAILLAIAVAAAAFTWRLVLPAGAEFISPIAKPLWIGGAIGGLILALITWSKPAWAPATAPLYAVVKGVFLGAISAMYSLAYGGIVGQAVTLTIGITFLMAALYVLRVIQPTAKFKAVVISATSFIFFFYIITFALSFFNIHVPFIHGSGAIGIGFSVFVVVLAALNLIIDFEMVEVGAAQGAPKHMEWYVGFAILVTLVWLYIELLRLLAKLRGR